MKFGMIDTLHGGTQLTEIARSEDVRLFRPGDVNRGETFRDWLRENDGNAVVLVQGEGIGDASAEILHALLKEFPRLRLLPLGGEAAMMNLCADGEVIAEINRYDSFGGEQNRRNLFRYLRWRYGEAEKPDAPLPLPRRGIFEMENGETVYPTLAAYIAALNERGQELPEHCVGLLCHRNMWEQRDWEAEHLLVCALAARGVGTVCAFAEMGHSPSECRNFAELLEDFFAVDGVPRIDGLINRTQLVAPVETFREWNVPVFNAVSTAFTSVGRCKEDKNPLAGEMAWVYMEPELYGLVEPTLISARGDQGKRATLPENVERFAARIARWVTLRHKPEWEKRAVIMLHNAPCAGVEATLGCAYELDAFESAARILQRLRKEGWQIDPVPADGAELRRWILERKAYSDFRWTSVEDIVTSGGCLYRMGMAEYHANYDKLSEENRRQIEEMYGSPPGEGMVLNDELIVTGIDLGHALVMIEPKRGCYGAKCTGEVCKILQDPLCPPPHQYLAAHWYIAHEFGADALIQVGTHASIEYLPGKVSGMSARCWPVIALGELPQIDLYNSSVAGESMVAKRRANAVIVDHLPAVSMALSPDRALLARRIADWQRLTEEENPQVEQVLDEIRELLSGDGSLRNFVAAAESEADGLRLLRQALLRGSTDPSAGKRHIFGEAPGDAEIASYICELWRAEGTLTSDNEEELSTRIQRSISGAVDVLRDGALAVDAAELAEALRACSGEMDALMDALRGNYIEPGIYGSPEDNGRESLPTGRNLYAADAKKVPSRAAYAVGRKLCDGLLEKYIREEGRYPEQVSMNMISLDITRSKGEQFSQVLCLLGIRPVWDARDNLVDLAVVPLEELGRPRVDVIVRITGILRDAWPGVVEWMDRAVMLAASLDEPEEKNYVRRHSAELLRKLKAADVADAERRANIRIFGDPPGAFGSGIDLALKASAWKDDRDLVRYFVEMSSHAYGLGLSGQRAPREFVQSAGHTDVTYDVTASRRYDITDAGFTAEVHGGFAMLAKLRGRRIRHYQGSTEDKSKVRVMNLDEKLQEGMQDTLLNPLWRERMMARGYEGGGEIMHRLQNAFSWQVMTGAVGDAGIDQLVRAYVLDEKMREFLLRENRFALEESARRFLELAQRGRWQADEECLNALKETYLQIEGNLEDGVSGEGEIQAGAIEIVGDGEVESWQRRLRAVDAILEEET